MTNLALPCNITLSPRVCVCRIHTSVILCMHADKDWPNCIRGVMHRDSYKQFNGDRSRMVLALDGTTFHTKINAYIEQGCHANTGIFCCMKAPLRLPNCSL